MLTTSAIENNQQAVSLLPSLDSGGGSINDREAAPLSTISFLSFMGW